MTTGYPVASTLVGAAAAFLAAALVAGRMARSGFPVPNARGRIGCVDGLRGILALSVLVHHFVIWVGTTRLGGAWSAPSPNLLNQFGAGGVALFFMTSGLVFYPRVRAGFRATPWPALLVGRVFRIVPLLAASVAGVTALVMARTGRWPDADFPAAAGQWIATWAEPPLLGYPDSGRLNAYVLWSLWYEWMFYLLVLPACAFAADLIRGRLPGWVVPAALLVVPLVLQGLRHRPPPVLLVLPLFAIGMLADELLRWTAVARWLRTPAASVAALAALALGMTAFPTPYGLALPLFGLFFTCVAAGSSMGGILRTAGARVLGECSYGVYLLHGLALSLLFADAGAVTGLVPTEDLPLLLPPLALAVVLVAAVAHLTIERPAIRLGARLAGRARSAGVSALAVR